MNNTWKINFNGSNDDFEETLLDFFEAIKEEVREKVNSSGKKYFNFKDMCTLQLLEYAYGSFEFNSEDDFMDTILEKSMAEDSVTFAYNYSSESFDESYDSGVKDFIKDIMQYCKYFKYFVHNVEIKFFFMDSSENSGFGDCSEYVSDSDNDSDIDGDSDCD